MPDAMWTTSITIINNPHHDEVAAMYILLPSHDADSKSIVAE